MIIESEPVVQRADKAVRVLVIEDEESYRDALAVGLGNEGYEIEVAEDGQDGLRRFAEHRVPDLVLLDLLLPGMSGTEVCRRMRALAPVPVIMVTALGSEVDVVLGLDLGASDYVTKPFRLRELVARMQAVLRRSPSSWPVLGPPSSSTDPRARGAIEAGPVRVDLGQRYVAVKGREVYLSRLEFDLLAVLLSPPGQVRTREELIDQLWAGRELTDTRTLDTHVRRLRVKLEDEPARPAYLLTVRGVGFRFDPRGDPH